MKKSVQNITNIVVFGILTSLTFSAQAKFDEIRFYPQKTWQLDMYSEYRASTSNYASTGGVYTNLPAGNYYNLFSTDFSFRTLVPKKNWAWYGGTEVAYGMSKNTVQSLTSTNFPLVKLGTDYVMYHGNFLLIPDLYVEFPTAKNDFNSTNITAVGDGTTKLSAQLRIQGVFNGMWLGAYSGFIYRDQGRSSVIPYGIVGELPFTSWIIGGSVTGYSSATYDSNTNNPTQQVAWNNNVNGGSQMFDSINPQVLEANGWLKWRLGREYSILLGGGSTLSGSNMANYWNVNGGISYRLGTKEVSSAPQVAPPKPNPFLFQEETADGVDQSVFQKEEVVPQTKPAPQDYSPNLQNELNKTENQMELKLKKKKKTQENP
jgi:hypothetical protein